MSNHIRISVVIACYQQSRELDLVLSTFLEQSLDRRLYELIVIDDHSPDTSAREVVARARAVHGDAQIHYLRNWRSDGGRYGASAPVKNAGIRVARGDIVFFNNAEIAQAGESLRHTIATMDAAPEPLCLRGVVIDLPYDDIAGRTPAGRDALHDAVPRQRERVATADHAGLAAVPRHALLRVGGIDERFDYWGKEDLDLAARLKRIGVVYRYDEALKSFHISHPRNHLKEGDYRRMCALLEDSNAAGRVEANPGRPWGVLGQTPADHLDAAVAMEIDSAWDRQRLGAALEAATYGPRAALRETLLVCDEAQRSELESWLWPRWPRVPVVAYDHRDTETLMRRLLRHVRAPRLAWMPSGAAGSEVNAPAAVEALRRGAAIAPWLTMVDAPEKSATPHPAPVCGWIADRELIDMDADWGLPSAWVMRAFADAGAWSGQGSRWAAAPVCRAGVPLPSASGAVPITATSSVLVAIPHHGCEPWLASCLQSIVDQTRAPEAIAVVHDGPDQAPVDVVSRFPRVSLYRSTERVGPYGLVQTLIDRTSFDAVMFQDADDWSSRERLAMLLDAAEQTGAELVGSQELRVDDISGRAHAVCYPLDVNRALEHGPGHPLLHPTSLVATGLLRRLGGFATGLRFGADTEMLLRAGFVARIVNLPVAAYFRRHRSESLTTHPDTGLESPARKELLATIKTRARENQALHATGKAPELRPLARSEPVALVHLAGPELLV